MQHIEFFHTEHFENNYHRVPPPTALGHFVDFFWETKFDHLWKLFPKGFSDAQFPNIGFTYIINLGTPFVMQVNEKKFTMKTDGLLPRYNAIECFHKTGNHLFGIKFRISPVIFKKSINFSEYKEYVFPLSYFVDLLVLDKVKNSSAFEERVAILSKHFMTVINQHKDLLHPVHVVSKILDRCFRENDFSVSLETLAAQNKISLRTLQRYFEKCTGISGKNALQIMRIRKATAHLANSPGSFSYSLYGYYDHSHFYKHLRRFLQQNTLKNLQAHLQLLENLHKQTQTG